MAKIEVEVTNESGLHTRPGNDFVKMAKEFNSKIEVENEKGSRVKGTSLLKILSLGIKKGSKVIIHANGEDETVAVEKLGNFLATLAE